MKSWWAIGLCITLAACWSAPKSPPTPPPPPPPPDITKELPVIKNVVGQMQLAGPLQFAGPLPTANKDDPPYIICLKSTSETRFTVALFFKGDKYDSARMATMADRCDSQAYQPLPN
jgi:hypothetical protein